jgi:BCD family chlorophyll transporter-like MFS transporter
MMDLSPTGRAGTFLGFWTMVEVIGRGVGLTTGGVVRDQVLAATGNLNLSYGAVFVLEVIGLLLALWVLNRINVGAFKSDYEDEPTDTATILVGAMD